MRAWCVLIALLAGACGVPDGTVGFSMLWSPGRPNTNNVVYKPLRLVASVDAAGETFTVLRDERPLATLQGKKGVLRFEVDGRPLALELDGLSADPNCDDRPGRGSGKVNIKCSDVTSLVGRLSSPAGPLPGTIAALPGAARRHFLATVLPAVLAGLLVAWIGSRKLWLGVLLGIATIAGAAVVGYQAGGLFFVTYAVAFLAYAGAGLFGGTTWHENSRLGGISLAIAPILGSIPVILAAKAKPHWDIGGPLVPVAFSAIAVIVVGALLLGLTAILGKQHAVSRWLDASSG